jgi:hypothetical protein
MKSNRPFRPASRAESPGAIAEVQGLYGPFTFSEKLFQRIWLQGDFDRGAATTSDGRRVRVIHPGRWNRLGGPDFRDARLRFDDGAEQIGDVELHLHAADWVAHGHAKDRAYDGVILHVVLFPPSPGSVTIGAAGREIPVLPLLPWLHHDLEEYAAEEAVEHLANRPASRVLERLGALASADLERLLRVHAGQRWNQKTHFARLRVQRLGWEAACHGTALEILGYRFNRAPMLRIAGQWPLSAWAAGGIDVREIFQSEAAAWKVQGVRPANHPLARLRQYAAWTAARPDWPARLAAAAAEFSAIGDAETTGAVRRAHRLRARRAEVAAAVCGVAVSGPRFDNLVCDGFLPLLAARGGKNGFGFWVHWFPGDQPPTVVRALRDLGVFAGRSRPAAHGAVQGLLGWLIEGERQTSAAAGSGA